MDNFRWILLAVGIFIIAVIYLMSRKNKRDFYQGDDDPSEDLPDIKTTSWEDLDEGVGEVRIIARSQDQDSPVSADGSATGLFDKDKFDADAYDEDDALMAVYRSRHDAAPAAAPSPAADSVSVSELESEIEFEPEPEPEIEPAPEPAQQAKPETAREPEPTPEAESGLAEDSGAEAGPSETVLVFNIMARDGSSLHGDSINSVAHANDMIFGDMNIYHRMDSHNQPEFSMINMVKPGSFDPATIHELSTPGVSLFMQLPGPDNASDAFTDMLHTAYRMSENLEARLCDQRRQPLTESVVEEYRNIAASFDGRI